MKKMKILITNTAFSHRSGSELYAKEVAKELAVRGHDVIAYSDICGDLAKKMKKEGIRVIDDLEKIDKGWTPDIIHGQHHLETMTAIAKFPNTPVAYFCLGWRPWQEKPPIHPMIVEYETCDLKTLQFMVDEGISKSKIRLIHNFVDLTIFKERKKISKTPKRALIFNNVASEENYVSVVREACQKANIELSVVGSSYGNATDKPEEIIKKHDIVFSYGRSSWEALTTGAAVVVCGPWGVGPMVTSKNVDKLKDLNFGVAAVFSELKVEALYDEITKYDADDLLVLMKKIREIARIEYAINKMEDMYQAVIAFKKGSKTVESSKNDALASYLREIAIFFKQKEIFEIGQIRRLEKEKEELNYEKSELLAKVDFCQRKERELEIEVEKLGRMLQKTKEEKDSCTEESKAIKEALKNKQEEIAAMKYSKFWQAREVFVRVRKKFKK